MKAYLIQDAIGEISDKLIIDAERAWQRKMRRTPKAIFLLAACITICLSLMLAVFNRVNDPLTDKPNVTPPGNDHSGVTPPEDNSIPDTPIDPDSLSEVLEIGYDAKTSVGGVDSCFKIAAKIDRSISLLQEKIPVTISYGISKGVKIDYFDIIGASEYKIAIYYADSNDYIILKEMNVKELFEKESFFDVDIFCDDNGDIINEIYKFCTEEIFYLDSEVIINSIINYVLCKSNFQY